MTKVLLIEYQLLSSKDLVTFAEVMIKSRA